MRRELFGERHPDIAQSLQSVGGLYGRQGDLQRASDYSRQALDMYCELLGERHPSTIETAVQLAAALIRAKRSSDAYHLVVQFLKRAPADGPATRQLKVLEAQLLSTSMRPGFRQPPKAGKAKRKKKRN